MIEQQLFWTVSFAKNNCMRRAPRSLLNKSGIIPETFLEAETRDKSQTIYSPHRTLEAAETNAIGKGRPLD